MKIFCLAYVGMGLMPCWGNAADLKMDRFGDPLPRGAVARLGTVRLRHTPSVIVAAWSADSKRLVTATHFALCVWEVPTGRLVGRVPLSGPPTGLAVSPDGRWIAVNQEASGQVLLIDSQTLKVVRRILADTYCLAFSPNSERLACAAASLVVNDAATQLSIFEVTTGKKLHSIDVTKYHGIARVAFLPDGQAIAGVDVKGVIRRWNARTLRESPALGKVAAGVWNAKFTSDGGSLLERGSERSLLLRSTSTGQRRELCKLSRMKIAHYAISADRKLLGVGLQNGETRLVRVSDGRTLRTLKPAGSVADSTPPELHSFSPDGKLGLLMVGGRLEIWNLASGDCLTPRVGPALYSFHLGFSRNSQRVYTVDKRGELHTWSALTGRHLDARLLTRNENSRYLYTFAPQSGIRATFGRANQIALQQINPYRTIRTIDIGKKRVDAVALAPDAGSLVCLTSFESADVRSVATGEVRFSVPPWKKGDWNDAEYAPDGKRIVFVGWNAMQIHDRKTGSRLARLTPPRENPDFGEADYLYHQAGFIPGSNKLFAVLDKNRTSEDRYGSGILIWDPETGAKKEWDWPKRTVVWIAAVSPDGKLLAVGALKYQPGHTYEKPRLRTFSIQLWDVAAGKLRAEVIRPLPVIRLAFSANGKRLASAAFNTETLIWDVPELLRMGR